MRSGVGELMASCYCGRVQLRAAYGAIGAAHCHCGQCRRLSGAPFSTYVTVGANAYTLSGGEHVVAFAATPNMTRHFCGRCGSHVYTSDRQFPDSVGVSAGAITEQSLVRPESHYFFSDKIEWCPVADDLPEFGGESGTQAL